MIYLSGGVTDDYSRMTTVVVYINVNLLGKAEYLMLISSSFVFNFLIIKTLLMRPEAP